MMTFGTMPRVCPAFFAPSVVPSASPPGRTSGDWSWSWPWGWSTPSGGSTGCSGRKAIDLVTNDVKRSPKRVVGDYLRRWSIEMLIKDQKQNLGLGAYRVLRTGR